MSRGRKQSPVVVAGNETPDATTHYFEHAPELPSPNAVGGLDQIKKDILDLRNRVWFLEAWVEEHKKGKA